MSFCRAQVLYTKEEKTNYEIFTVLCRITGQLNYIIDNVRKFESEKHSLYLQHSLGPFEKCVEEISYVMGKSSSSVLCRAWEKPTNITLDHITYDPKRQWIKIFGETCSEEKSEEYETITSCVVQKCVTLRDILVRCREGKLRWISDPKVLAWLVNRLWEVFRRIGKYMVSVIEGHGRVKLGDVELLPQPCTECKRIKPRPKKVKKCKSCKTCGMYNN